MLFYLGHLRAAFFLSGLYFNPTLQKNFIAERDGSLSETLPINFFTKGILNWINAS